MEASQNVLGRKARAPLHGAARRRKAVIYHNYTSGPISSHPLAVIPECAVVLSAVNAERGRSLECDGVHMSRVVVSAYDVFQREPALRSQRLKNAPISLSSDFNGPIN